MLQNETFDRPCVSVPFQFAGEVITIQETHTAYNAITQYTRQSLNETQYT